MYTLWLFDIPMEHGPFIDDNSDGSPTKNAEFPVRKALNNQR